MKKLIKPLLVILIIIKFIHFNYPIYEKNEKYKNLEKISVKLLSVREKMMPISGSFINIDEFPTLFTQVITSQNKDIKNSHNRPPIEVIYENKNKEKRTIYDVIQFSVRENILLKTEKNIKLSFAKDSYKKEKKNTSIQGKNIELYIDKTNSEEAFLYKTSLSNNEINRFILSSVLTIFSIITLLYPSSFLIGSTFFIFGFLIALMPNSGMLFFSFIYFCMLIYVLKFLGKKFLR